MQAWSHIPSAASGRGPGLLYQSASDGAGEAMSGAITIPDLVLSDPLFYGMVYLAFKTNNGAATGATTATGFGGTLYSSIGTLPPAIATAELRLSMRFEGAPVAGAQTVIQSGFWATPQSYWALAVFNSNGNPSPADTPYHFIGNALRVTYVVGGLTGPILLQSAFALFVPRK